MDRLTIVILKFSPMDSNKKIARLAGMLYLVVVLAGIFSLLYVPSQIIVWNDPSLTISNIKASETLYRAGAVSGLVCYTFFLVLPLALYKLLSHVNRTHAVLMVTLAVVSVPISFISIFYKFNVLTILGDAAYLQALDPKLIEAQVILSLEAYNTGILIAGIFWGLWLFPFGYLVFKSGILPKFFGICLMLGALGYIISFLGTALYPSQYADTGLGTFISIPGTIGEIGICLWMLIAGAKEQRTPVLSQPSLSS